MDRALEIGNHKDFDSSASFREWKCLLLAIKTLFLNAGSADPEVLSKDTESAAAEVFVRLGLLRAMDIPLNQIYMGLAYLINTHTLCNTIFLLFDEDDRSISKYQWSFTDILTQLKTFVENGLMVAGEEYPWISLAQLMCLTVRLPRVRTAKRARLEDAVQIPMILRRDKKLRRDVEEEPVAGSSSAAGEPIAGPSRINRQVARRSAGRPRSPPYRSDDR